MTNHNRYKNGFIISRKGDFYILLFKNMRGYK